MPRTLRSSSTVSRSGSARAHLSFAYLETTKKYVQRHEQKQIGYRCRVTVYREKQFKNISTSTRFTFKEHLFYLALFVTLPQIVPKQNTAATRARNIPRKLRRCGEAFSVEYRSCTLLVIEWGGKENVKT